MITVMYNGAMGLANKISTIQRAIKPTVRVATKADENTVLRLLDTTEKRHLHADWRMPTEWLGQPSCVVYEQDSLRGYLSATLDPPPIAWIRALCVKKHDPVPVVREMVAFAADDLRATNATTIACLTVNEWVDQTLPQVGFTAERKMQAWVKTDWVLPKSGIDQPDSANRVQVRPVEPDDYLTLIKIERRAFPEPLWWHSEAQLRLGKRFSFSFDVAELNGRIVGFQYSTAKQGQYVHLVRVAVDPSAQGNGVGHALMAHAINGYKKIGVNTISLNTHVGNAPAARLYRKFGFEPAGHQFNVWEMAL